MDRKEYRKFGNRKKPLYKSAKFDPLLALAKIEGGASLDEAAKTMVKFDGTVGVSKNSIHSSLKTLVGDEKLKDIRSGKYKEAYKERVMALLADKYEMALEAITEDKLEKESASKNAMTAKLLHEQYRLESNESTQNIASFVSLVEASMEDGEL